MKKLFKLKLVKVFCIIIGIFLIGAIWQTIMVRQETNKYTPVGKFVDAGTYKAHYYSQGEGDIAFVFISGSGTPCSYTDFYPLQNALSSQGQTITFDHAGSGWSTNTGHARSIENLTEELSTIINTVAKDKPIVLLCHSLGALEAIGYTQAFPERVAGIVFLDSGSPEYYSTDSEFAAKIMNRSLAFARVVGMPRLLGECGVLLPIYGENIRNSKLPDDLKEMDRAMYYRYAGNPSTLGSIRLMNENALKVMDGNKLNTPILVLSAQSTEQWNKVALQLAAWSDNSTQVTLQGAQHYLHWSNVDEVVSYIDAFIAENIK